MPPRLHVLRLLNTSIFDQLRLEEALLRSHSGNWVVLNQGLPTPSIVMGISGVVDKLVNIDVAKKANVPVIRRFTGGGTVIVDDGTVFISFICNKADVSGTPQYPRELMRWSTEFYAPVLDSIVLPEARGTFGLQEHDYCLGDKKFGGNAQTISRDRWVHHTSFLWDFHPKNMELLRLPEKRPDYRRDRPHGDFLTKLRSHTPAGSAPAELHEAVLHRLRRMFDVASVDAEEAWEIARASKERQSNVYVDY